MSACSPQELLTLGKCLGSACSSPQEQMQLAIALVYRWSGSTKTRQELLADGKCFGASCMGWNAQVQAALGLLCRIYANSVTCFTLDTSTTPDTGSGDGTATATPVGGVGPFTYAWSNGQTTQTATGLVGGTSPVGDYNVIVDDTGVPDGICGQVGQVHIDISAGCVPVTDAPIYTGASADPQFNPWDITGGTAATVGFDVQVTGSITAIHIPGEPWLDGTFDLTPLASCLTSFSSDDAPIQALSVAGLVNLSNLALNNCSLSTFTANLPSLTLVAIYATTTITSIDLTGCSGLTYCGPQNNPALTTLTIVGCNALTTVVADGCALDQASVDGVLQQLDGAGLFNGTVNLSGGTSSAPSGSGATDAANLVFKGWTVTTN